MIPAVTNHVRLKAVDLNEGNVDVGNLVAHISTWSLHNQMQLQRAIHLIHLSLREIAFWKRLILSTDCKSVSGDYLCLSHLLGRQLTRDACHLTCHLASTIQDTKTLLHIDTVFSI